MRNFANFVRLYLPHVTTFFNQILEFYCAFKRFIPEISFALSRSKVSQKFDQKLKQIVHWEHDILFPVARACSESV